MMIDDSGKRKLFIHRSREIVDNFRIKGVIGKIQEFFKFNVKIN